jgi:hypothetical protein
VDIESSQLKLGVFEMLRPLISSVTGTQLYAGDEMLSLWSSLDYAC